MASDSLLSSIRAYLCVCVCVCVCVLCVCVTTYAASMVDQILRCVCVCHQMCGINGT